MDRRNSDMDGRNSDEAIVDVVAAFLHDHGLYVTIQMQGQWHVAALPKDGSRLIVGSYDCLADAYYEALCMLVEKEGVES